VADKLEGFCRVDLITKSFLTNSIVIKIVLIVLFVLFLLISFVSKKICNVLIKSKSCWSFVVVTFLTPVNDRTCLY